MTSTDRFARTVRTVSVVSGAFIVLCLLTTIALAVLGRPDEQITAVEVHDDAEVLDTVLVEEEIAALDTYSPVRVVVWTRDGAQSDNVNAETLEWARGRPDDGLLSPDGRYWADGTLVVTLSVEETTGTGSGEVGTYFGEDIAVEPPSAQQELQAHGYDHFQALNWDTGVVAIADAAAGEMARPAWTRFGITFGIPVGLALLAAANIVGVRTMSRRFLAANDRFSVTTQDVHTTVSESEYVLDLDHGFGSRIKSTAGSVLRQYDRTLEDRDAIAEASVWTVNAANIPLWRDIRSIRSSAEDIEDSSGLLRRATTLYMGSGEWKQVWDEEIEETAEHLRTARDDGGLRRRAGATAAAELHDFCTTALVRLEDVADRGAAGGGENISECLGEIAEIRGELTQRMTAIERAAAPKNSAKARYVDRAIADERWRRNDRSRSITGFYDRRSFYSPRSFIVGFAVGARSHRRAVEREKRVQSSGGSRTSYGASGGGFRGSGSSSRF
ncbi:DUF5129 domain-containing protein [Brevibacterium yomogidense]|uniref:DUF5129 domain-containing protein n=1 Tax=Brevibacterium yomogidense TaxID=946573 RepID=A0A1X6XEI4_9MICO|nr:DUF5129 domain-containing protein [Brevibacterium yomogidense]SLM97674.1 hypothetical protein FM105_07500 [Brevibacterium yomogidense]